MRTSQGPVMNERMRRRDETPEERMRLVRLALKFRMKLRRDEKGMRRDLDDLDQLPVGRRAAQDESGVLEIVAVFIVELVAVPVPFVNHERAVNLGRPRIRLEL